MVALRELWPKITQRLEGQLWIIALLTRLYVGYFFLETGLGKLHDLDAFTERFIGWGIPFPAFSAALSAVTECVGGALTVVGLLTRLVSVPMIINMLVAVATVKIKSVSSLDEFVEMDEPLYALAYAWLLVAGAGRFSLDQVLAARFLRAKR